jgi:hypothetical protein
VETKHLRRKTISLERLDETAPQLILAMLEGLRHEPDADAASVLNEGDIRSLYGSLRVNKAELLGLRLYTGPMFEFVSYPHACARLLLLVLLVLRLLWCTELCRVG